MPVKLIADSILRVLLLEAGHIGSTSEHGAKSQTPERTGVQH